jgi:hypothetical protein
LDRRFVTDDCVEEGGGESACFAHLICPECGTVLDDTAHRKDCSWMNSESRIELTPDDDPDLGD